MPISRALTTAPPGSRAGCSPMRADWSLDLEHDRKPPGIDVGQRFVVGKLDAPVALDLDLADRAAVTLRLVEIDQPVGHGLARQHLHLWIERGAHGEAAFVELLLAVVLVEVAADLFGEIFGRECVRAGRPHRRRSAAPSWLCRRRLPVMKPSSTMRSIT